MRFEPCLLSFLDDGLNHYVLYVDCVMKQTTLFSVSHGQGFRSRLRQDDLKSLMVVEAESTVKSILTMCIRRKWINIKLRNQDVQSFERLRA